MKFVSETLICTKYGRQIVYCGVVEDQYKIKRDLVFYWSVFTRKYVFNSWFRVEGDVIKVTEDVPEDMRMALDSPFFEIDMLKYCSENDLKLIERY